MGSTLIQFRTEDNEKLKAVQILDRLGLSLQSYLKMCVLRLNQENGIPFSMKIETASDPGIKALRQAQAIAEQYGIADMTLDEINEEISEARK